MSDTNDDPNGNIWITSRIRMDVHEKFVKLNHWSHILLTIYSVALLGFSVFEPHLVSTPIGPYSAEVSILLSFSVLCASLVVWGLDFSSKARNHRDCYLALQRLYDDPIETNEKQKNYQEILDKYPNHSKADYESFLFRKLIIEKGELKTKNGLMKMSGLRVAKFLLYQTASFLTLLMLVSAPAIVIVLIYVSP